MAVGKSVGDGDVPDITLVVDTRKTDSRARKPKPNLSLYLLLISAGEFKTHRRNAASALESLTRKGLGTEISIKC